VNIYAIYLDGLAYGGERAEGEGHAANVGAGGWHQANQGAVSTLIIGQGAPYQVRGRRNLASHLDRILRRMEMGLISPRRVEIVRLDEVKA
jgi:hypothetical protein